MTASLAGVERVLGPLDEMSLDGTWEFFPGDHQHSALDLLDPEPIEVPGLWEAQGHLELDGVAWYRRRFDLSDVGRHWTLRFAAVMDLAEVHLNGIRVGEHRQPFVPFELPVSDTVRPGRNVLDVRVTDPPLHDPMHLRMAHGKQGWANDVFPSRPSLYMTYGGIWQPVTLRRHGPLVINDIFVNADPDDLRVQIQVHNVTDTEVWAVVGVRTLGLVREQVVRVPPGERSLVDTLLGPTSAPRWCPGRPALHDLLVDVVSDEALSDRRRVRYGLRTVRIDGSRLLINDEPYRMKSALVQGFRADTLYAEGTREQIVEEVRAAQAMGFNTLRLHIKGFAPRYLDVCDELGMLLHCDLPVAEPIAHEELGDGTGLSEQAVEAVTQQVRRDRNHPSIVLWSAMNELGLDREGVRQWPVYEQFARTLYGAVAAADSTRPVIENDWVEPDPDRVFRSPILTAHWYGRLHSDYLDKLDRSCGELAGCDRPFYVTEFGDWGLPAMPQAAQAPFWDPHDVYAAGLAATLWPATVGRFVRETQRYQGLSDRLQIEVFRRHDHVGGYCLTELTDVPHELNGLLDLHRRPKPLAVEEIVRANQPVLPMLRLDGLVVSAGQELRAPLYVANDGPELDGVEVTARFGGAHVADLARLAAFDPTQLDPGTVEARFSESVAGVRVGRLAAHTAQQVGEIGIRAPEVSGGHDLVVTLTAGGAVVAENRYPIHVVDPAHAPYEVQAAGPVGPALAAVGARVGDSGPLVVAEDHLDAEVGDLVRRRLAAGETVLLLSQPPESAGHYPLPTEVAAVQTEWGSSVFHFTTDSGALPSMPRRNVLVAEESTIQARSAIVRMGDGAFPEEPVVIAYKPVPGCVTGWVVGAHAVGKGRLICCQYRVTARAVDGDAAATALLASLVRWAADPSPATQRQPAQLADGRSLTYYGYPAGGTA